jgi:hypothetical protein
MWLRRSKRSEDVAYLIFINSRPGVLYSHRDIVTLNFSFYEQQSSFKTRSLHCFDTVYDQVGDNLLQSGGGPGCFGVLGLRVLLVTGRGPVRRGDRGARGARGASSAAASYPLGAVSAAGVAALSAVSAGAVLARLSARLLRISSR